MKKNDEMNLERYFLVPVFLLRDLTSNKEKALNGMTDYGLYNLAKKSNLMEMLTMSYTKEQDN